MAGLGSGQSDPVHGSQEAAERARAAARQSAAWMRDEASRLYDNYTKQTKYFKWRSWIVASYAFVTLVSLTTVYGLTHNSINAYIAPPALDPDGHLLIHVENNSNDDWTRVKVILNGEYEFEAERVTSGQPIQPNGAQFHKIGSKVLAPKNLVVKNVKVKCDQGSFSYTVQ